MKFNIIHCEKKSEADSFYDTQIDKLRKDIDSYEIGSEEWATQMANLEQAELQKAKVDGYDRAKKRDKGNIGKSILNGISVIGPCLISLLGIGMTWETAKMSYASDEEMKMCNGNVRKISNDYKNYYKTK